MKKQILQAILFVILGNSVVHAEEPSCSAWAERAAAAHNIPPNLLAAISTVETQRNGAPWPWTLNEGGKSHYFDTKEEALRYLTDAVARGVKNIDVGCMQLNFRWHAAGFSSLEAMLDPRKNTNYAALFLVELKKRVGSWEEATKHYHSADDARGNAYRDKVVRAAMNLPASDLNDVVGGTEVVTKNIGGTSGGETIMIAGEAAARAFETIVASLEVEEPRLQTSDNADVIHDMETLPPRLSRRWEELQRVRKALAGRP